MAPNVSSLLLPEIAPNRCHLLDKATLTAGTGFLEDQDAVLSRSKERTVPVSLLVKHAKSYDLKTNSYGNGCFAFFSTGGNKDERSS